MRKKPQSLSDQPPWMKKMMARIMESVEEIRLIEELEAAQHKGDRAAIQAAKDAYLAFRLKILKPAKRQRLS